MIIWCTAEKPLLKFLWRVNKSINIIIRCAYFIRVIVYHSSSYKQSFSFKLIKPVMSDSLNTPGSDTVWGKVLSILQDDVTLLAKLNLVVWSLTVTADKLTRRKHSLLWTSFSLLSSRESSIGWKKISELGPRTSRQFIVGHGETKRHHHEHIHTFKQFRDN